MSAAALSKRPDYGIDAPGVLLAIFLAGIAAELVGFFGPPSVKIGPVTFEFGASWNIMGAVFLGEALLWRIYVKHGKFRHRDRMLGQISWTGGERVLDVGTGRGLLLIGAAKRLTTGTAVGIDIWSTRDLSGNAPEATEANIAMEGVAAKCGLLSEDASKMSFPDASFDVAVSNLCIHNIQRQSGRDQACREITRVLPGGIAVISDYKRTKQCAAIFTAEGFSVEFRGPFWTDDFPPLRFFVVRKPA